MIKRDQLGMAVDMDHFMIRTERFNTNPEPSPIGSNLTEFFNRFS